MLHAFNIIESIYLYLSLVLILTSNRNKKMATTNQQQQIECLKRRERIQIDCTNFKTNANTHAMHPRKRTPPLVVLKHSM